MENSTKALLIAGALLVVILLITFSIKILNSTGDPSKETKKTIDAVKVAAFNEDYLNLTGKNRNNEDVIKLLNLVIMNNTKKTNEEEHIKVTLIALDEWNYKYLKDNLYYSNTINFNGEYSENWQKGLEAAIHLLRTSSRFISKSYEISASSYDEYGYVNGILIKG